MGPIEFIVEKTANLLIKYDKSLLRTQLEESRMDRWKREHPVGNIFLNLAKGTIGSLFGSYMHKK